MPRQKSTPARTERAIVNHEAVQADTRAMDADAPRRIEIARLFLDGEAFDKHRVLDRMRLCAQQAAGPMYEMGKCLVALKEFLPHGEFIDTIEQFGMSVRSVQLMMGAAVKLVHLKEKDREQILSLNASKIYELALLEDGDLAALAKGKTVAGIELDDLDLMSTRELREKVKEAREELGAKDRVIEQKDKKINKLLEADAKRPEWQKTFDTTIEKVSKTGDALMRACADLARLAEEIAELEFEGVERDNDTLALRAQIANRYYDLSEHLLEQSVGLWVGSRSQFIEGLLSLARKRLPDEVKAKIFGEQA